MALFGPRWPDERTQRLRTLYAMGKGDAEIAHFLGVSKGAVIGKRQRLDLFRTYRRGERSGDPLMMALRRAERDQPDQGKDQHPADRAE